MVRKAGLWHRRSAEGLELESRLCYPKTFSVNPAEPVILMKDKAGIEKE